MTVEERVKIQLGEMTMQILALVTQLEEANKKIEELKAELITKMNDEFEARTPAS